MCNIRWVTQWTAELSLHILLLPSTEKYNFEMHAAVHSHKCFCYISPLFGLYSDFFSSKIPSLICVWNSHFSIICLTQQHIRTTAYMFEYKKTLICMFVPVTRLWSQSHQVSPASVEGKEEDLQSDPLPGSCLEYLWPLILLPQSTWHSCWKTLDGFPLVVGLAMPEWGVLRQQRMRFSVV